MLRRKKFQVIYPEYFDSELSKKQGRRVNLKGRLLIPINKQEKKLKSELIVELAEIIRRIVVKQKTHEKQLNRKDTKKGRTKSAKNVIRRK